jgi:branched-chain amino acid transport system permease protein
MSGSTSPASRSASWSSSGSPLWLTYSRLGKATRAISDNSSLAAASGIDVDAVVRVVWVDRGHAGGLSGILYAYFRPGSSGTWAPGAAAHVRGRHPRRLGTAFGALVGRSSSARSSRSRPVDPVRPEVRGALVVLIVILLFRPQGILGRRERIG